MWRVSGKRFTIILFVDVIILFPLSKPKPPCWLFYKKEIILGSLSLAASAAEFSTRNGGLLHHPKDYKLSQVLLDAGARSKGYFSNLGLNPQWLSVLSPMWQTPLPAHCPASLLSRCVILMSLLYPNLQQQQQQQQQQQKWKFSSLIPCYKSTAVFARECLFCVWKKKRKKKRKKKQLQNSIIFCNRRLYGSQVTMVTSKSHKKVIIIMVIKF